jgi:hypothetical protein
MFSAVKACSKAGLNAWRKVSLLTKCIQLRAKAEIWSPYLRFNGAKQPTLRG